MTKDYTRRSYDPDGFKLSRREFDEAMVHLRQAIDGQPNGKKPFVVLHGQPGVGKSWLLSQIKHELERLGVRCSEIVQAQTFLPDPFAELEGLLRWCLQDDVQPIAGTTSREIVQDLSNQLDVVLRDRPSQQPLALFFDDIDHLLEWLPDPLPDGGGEVQDERLESIFKQLWWALIRHTHLPALIICTSRGEARWMTTLNPAIRRKLELVKVGRWNDQEMDTLVAGIRQDVSMPYAGLDAGKLLELAQRYACGHPLVADWLAWKLGQNPQAFDEGNRGASLGELANVLIADRITTDELGSLVQLVQKFPNGFNDQDITEGPGLVRRLTQFGLVGKIPNASNYEVLPPVSCLYAKEAPNG